MIEVTQSQKTNRILLTHVWILGIEQKITSSQSTPPEKLGSKEESKSDTHGPPEKGKGTRHPEQFVIMGRGS